MGRDMEGAAGRVQAPMAQQELDASQIDPRFEHMRREAVSQHMRVNRLGQVCGLPGVAADGLHRARHQGARPGVARKEPGARFILLPILP